jgi:RNA polymerase subunit RPABC4/transcription elongation factor Spt4
MVEYLKENGCSCPYCDEAVVIEASPFCKPCSVVLRYCGNCRIAVASELKECPQCGRPLE